MAYKNNNKQNSKTGSKKWAAFWAGAIAFILIAAIIVGIIGWRTTGFKDWTFGFGSPTVSTPNNDGIGDDNNDNYSDEKVQANHLLATLEASALAVSVVPYSEEDNSAYAEEGSYEISIEPDPSDSTDTYTWTISNDSAITLTVNANTKSATAVCNSAFGEPITITISSNLSEVSATVKLDYVKRVISATVNPTVLEFSLTETHSYKIEIVPEYGIGTLTPDKFDILGIPKITYNSAGTTVSIDDDSLDVTTPAALFASNLFFSTQITNYNNNFVKNAKNDSSDGTITIRFSYSHGGHYYGSDTATGGVAFDCSGMVVAATEITPNVDNVIF